METNYYKKWEQYVAEHPEIEAKYMSVVAPRIQGYEEMMFIFIMNLCV